MPDTGSATNGDKSAPLWLVILGFIITSSISLGTLAFSIYQWHQSNSSSVVGITASRRFFVGTPRYHKGDWSEIITGSGWRGDTQVNVYYPTAPAAPNQPQPTGGPANTNLCPTANTTVSVRADGTFTARFRITARLRGYYRVYAKGVNSGAEAFDQLTFVPSRNNPLPAPLSSTASSTRC